LNIVKNVLVIFAAILLVSCTANNDAQNSLQEFKKLGSTKFTAQSWKGASQEERASMVYDLLQNNSPIGKSRNNVLALLGEPTSYYDYDEFPAYVVGPKTITSEYAKGYVLAFIVNSSSGIVEDFEFVPKIE